MTTLKSSVFEGLGQGFVDEALDLSLQYALLSKPFTYNRIGRPLEEGVVNIAKGKFSEYLFRKLCKTAFRLELDVNSCQTPFWKRDQRDFLLAGREWDIKSIFLHACPPDLNFDDCPALIPNKSDSDQWSTRSHKFFPDLPLSPGYVFMFIGPIRFSLRLSRSQSSFLSDLCKLHNEREAQKEPFSEDWFNCHFPDRDALRLQVDHVPVVAIGGAASRDQWQLFVDQPVGPIKVSGLKVYQTAIWNKSCRSGDLPTFIDLVNNDRHAN